MRTPVACGPLAAVGLLFAALGFPFAEALPAAAGVSNVASNPVNLLTGDQATFSTSTGGWVGTNATLQSLPGIGDSGPGALGVTSTAASAAYATSGSPSAGGLTAASSGLLYTAGASTKAATDGEEVQPLLAFYNASGNVLTGIWGSETEASTGSWAQTTTDAQIAPPGTAWVSLYLRVLSSTPGVEVYFADAWIQETADDSASVAGPFHTSGNQILDAKGNPVIFRGVVLAGLDAFPNTTAVTEGAVDQAKAWGANFIRLPLGEQFWLSSNCDYDPNYATEIDQVVNWITSLGMVAVVELDTNTVGGCEAGGAHNMADEAQAPEFWSQVAYRYASNPLVAFDLYNEPHDISGSVWLDGGTTTDVYAPYQSYQTAGMQQLYDAVRAAGAQNLVFMSGNNWANTPPSQLVNGTNIVYAAHYYTCPGDLLSTCANPSPYDPSQDLDQWVGFSTTQPVMVTEFGWPSPASGAYNANVISFANEHGWGWSAFAWEHVNGNAWDLASWLPDGAAEANPSGMPVLCALATASSGSSPCTSPSTTSDSSGTGTAGSGPSVSAFVILTYLDLLGRKSDPGGLNIWLAALSAGMTRSQFAYDVATSSEYRTRLIGNIYSRYLGRAPDPGGFEASLGLLNAGATDEQLIADVVGSTEFFADAGSNNAGFVTFAYQTILQRTPDPGGLSKFAGLLVSGTSRTTVALDLLTSSEYRGDQLTGGYEIFLNRAPDAAGSDTWLPYLNSGATDEQLIGQLLGSAEFFNLAGT